MSFVEALDYNSKILAQYINADSIILPISNVESLQTNLNLLENEITAVANDVLALGNKPLFSEFYALMPGDNASTVAVGAAVAFPNDGATNSTIARSGASLTQFVLPDIGIYEVAFQVSFAEAGQLALALDGSILPNSVVGRATGTNQCYGHTLVTTVSASQVLSVINPAGNLVALTITPSAGGTHAVSANILIKQLA